MTIGEVIEMLKKIFEFLAETFGYMFASDEEAETPEA